MSTSRFSRFFSFLISCFSGVLVCLAQTPVVDSRSVVSLNDGEVLIGEVITDGNMLTISTALLGRLTIPRSLVKEMHPYRQTPENVLAADQATTPLAAGSGPATSNMSLSTENSPDIAV